MNSFQLTKGQSQEADLLFKFLLKQHNHIAFTDKISLDAFLVKKNFDQVNHLLRIIEENQPKEVIRVTHSEDNNWMVEGTGLLLDFMQQGGMKFYWDGQMERAREAHTEKAEKDKIERKALELDIELKKNIIDDYPKTKARAKRNEYIAWLSILVAAAAMVLQLILG